MDRWKNRRGAGLFAASLSLSLCLWPSWDTVIKMGYRCQLCNQCGTLAARQADLAGKVTVSTCLGLCTELSPLQQGEGLSGTSGMIFVAYLF